MVPPMRARSHNHARRRTASFGFREVPEAQKAPLVRGVFSSVAGRYDLMNDLMSGGVHRLWKSAMIDWLRPRPGQDFLDLAGGTGDIAFRILKRLEPDAAGRIVVCDLTPDMLDVGRDRALDKGLTARASSGVCGDAEGAALSRTAASTPSPSPSACAT